MHTINLKFFLHTCHTFSHCGKSFLQFVINIWSKGKIVDKHNPKVKWYEYWKRQLIFFFPLVYDINNLFCTFTLAELTCRMLKYSYTYLKHLMQWRIILFFLLLHSRITHPADCIFSLILSSKKSPFTSYW